MKRLSLAVAASLLLMPAQSLAAYMTPSELMGAIETMDSARSFSLTAHAKSDKTYVSIWANGTEKGRDPMMMQVTSKVTIDVVQGAMKARVKGEVMVLGGTMYLKLSSFDSTFVNAFASMSAAMKQLQWLSIPLDASMIEGIQTGGVADLSLPGGSGDADSMFQMQSTPGKNGGTVYTLSLTQDYAVTVAQMIRELLQDDSPVSDDFFPWRQLAEGLRFESTVFTDANGGFVSSNYELSTASTSSSLSIKGSQKKAGALSLQAPKNAVSIDQVMMMFSDIQGDLTGSGDMTDDSSIPSIMESDSMMTPDLSTGSFDSIDTVPTSSADCNDSSLSPIQLVNLQRAGVCPVQKKTTRHGGW